MSQGKVMIKCDCGATCQRILDELLINRSFSNESNVSANDISPLDDYAVSLDDGNIMLMNDLPESPEAYTQLFYSRVSDRFFDPTVTLTPRCFRRQPTRMFLYFADNSESELLEDFATYLLNTHRMYSSCIGNTFSLSGYEFNLDTVEDAANEGRSLTLELLKEANESVVTQSPTATADNSDSIVCGEYMDILDRSGDMRVSFEKQFKQPGRDEIIRRLNLIAESAGWDSEKLQSRALSGIMILNKREFSVAELADCAKKNNNEITFGMLREYINDGPDYVETDDSGDNEYKPKNILDIIGPNYDVLLDGVYIDSKRIQVEKHWDISFAYQGDILYVPLNERSKDRSVIFVMKSFDGNRSCHPFVALWQTGDNNLLETNQDVIIDTYDCAQLATEEQKKLLFKEIERNGLQWDDDALTLGYAGWMPKQDSEYYTIVERESSKIRIYKTFDVIEAQWQDNEIDRRRYNNGTVFKTKATAEQCCEQMNKSIREIIEKYHK